MEKYTIGKYDISVISGLLMVIAFCLFTFTAFLLFPPGYTPLNNFLSDLGSSSYNPSGFLFFNLGCIITGLLLFAFIIGLNKWYTSNKLQRNLLKLAQLIGFISAFALILVGVFSEDHMSIHSIVSKIFFLSLFSVILIANVSLFFHPMYKKAVLVYAILVLFAGFTLIFTPYFSTSLMEWLTVFLSLGWVGLVSLNMILSFNYES